MTAFDYNRDAVANLKIDNTSVLDPLVDFISARAAHMKKDRCEVVGRQAGYMRVKRKMC